MSPPLHSFPDSHLPTSSSSICRCITFTLVAIKSRCTRAVKGPAAGQGADLVLAADVLTTGGCRHKGGIVTEEKLSRGWRGCEVSWSQATWLLLPVRLVVVVVEVVVLT